MCVCMQIYIITTGYQPRLHIVIICLKNINKFSLSPQIQSPSLIPSSATEYPWQPSLFHLSSSVDPTDLPFLLFLSQLVALSPTSAGTPVTGDFSPSFLVPLDWFLSLPPVPVAGYNHSET